MDNIYTPPTTRTVYPPEGHLRTQPDELQLTEVAIMDHFTNYNKLFKDFVLRVKELVDLDIDIDAAKEQATLELGYTGQRSKFIFMPLNRFQEPKLIKSVRRIKNV